MFKLIPLLCTHIYLYMFSIVHPPSVPHAYIRCFQMYACGT